MRRVCLCDWLCGQQRWAGSFKDSPPAISVVSRSKKRRTAAATEQEEQILKFDAKAVRTERKLIPAGLRNQVGKYKPETYKAGFKIRKEFAKLR